MSVIAAFYSQENNSWIVAKNRDRSYRPVVRMRKSFRNEIERLYIWDEKTKYSEGINEFGVAIVNIAILSDEERKKNYTSGRTYYSPEGLRIRKALFEKSAQDALNTLIELEIPGNTIIADADRCFVLESFFASDEYEETEVYTYQYLELQKHEMCARTSMRILMPNIAETSITASIRYEAIKRAMYGVKTADDLLDALSLTGNENPQLNPLIVDESENAMRTTGQILIIPAEKTLCYRPAHCKTKFNFDALNDREEKTSFEIISHRKLLSFKNAEI